MDSIRGPNCQERSPNRRDFYSKQRKRTSAICWREGQASIPENEREEGRNWKASSMQGME